MTQRCILYFLWKQMKLNRTVANILTWSVLSSAERNRCWETYGGDFEGLEPSKGAPLCLRRWEWMGKAVTFLFFWWTVTSCASIEISSICAAQRHIGETSLNEVSSRSHQIIRLVCYRFELQLYRLTHVCSGYPLHWLLHLIMDFCRQLKVPLVYF